MLPSPSSSLKTFLEHTNQGTLVKNSFRQICHLLSGNWAQILHLQVQNTSKGKRWPHLKALLPLSSVLSRDGPGTGARQGEQLAAGAMCLADNCKWLGFPLTGVRKRQSWVMTERALYLIQIPFTQNLSSSINPSNSMSQCCLLWPFSPPEPPRPLWYFPCLLQSPFPVAHKHSCSISTPLLPFYSFPNTSKYCNSSNSLKHLSNLCKCDFMKEKC